MSEPWASLPTALAKEVSGCWKAVFPAGAPAWFAAGGVSEADLAEALGRSLFLRQTLDRHLNQIQSALLKRPLTEPTTEVWLRERLGEYLAPVDSEPGLHVALRQYRREVQFRIIWRDLMRWAGLEETMAATSAFADIAIDGALSWLYPRACEEFGTPWGRDPITGQDARQNMVVLGMGKLGGRELNVSSDIDLIFAFPSKGETRGGRRALDNQQFFVRLGQRLIQALDQMTADGFVFRVDMRLRPYGQSGALALSFAALETYYQDQGRDWERYAMVKARVVAGDQRAGEALMESLRPFVYRKYIDFSAFESLRSMKEMISREVRRKGLENNIKLGSGGIREIEFVVQAFQLIRGGRDRELQQRELLQILSELEALELLPSRVVDELRSAYVFLRNLEHALQGVEDRQTQILPEDDLSCARIARIMGHDGWAECLAELNGHRARVARHFADIIATEDQAGSDDSGVDDGCYELWLSEMDESAALDWLKSSGFEDPEGSYRRLANLRDGRTVQMLQTQGRKRLNQFVPLLLNALKDVEKPSETLERVLQLVEAILRRTAYMVLLMENPGAMTQLVRLCSDSPWIARLLAETPLLLDELLNADSLYSPPAKGELQDDLRQQMLRIPYEDLEDQMEALRYFKKAHVLRVAASELKGTLPLMKVSDYLTWIAEVVLDHVVDVAFSNLVARHGYPRRADGSACNTDFAIIGYGKLGGIELGYTSDLDLVFVHQADPQLTTDGEKPIDNAVFYTRLGQRIVHILSTQTPSGQLYEVDMRLRPSGNSGLLVSTLQAFEKYQQEDAWTWEHQALARARGVAGCAETLQAFERIRHQILCRPREKNALRREVSEMREKMRSTLGTPEASRGSTFHIKHDHGGIVDIEFMVQYLMLTWCAGHPELTQWSDNIRQMEELGRAGVLPVADTERLRDVFITLRSTIHRRALQNLNSQVDGGAFGEERAYIESMWQKVMTR
ncbi:bifunctional [glutamate--ammonia ligase]-adenylyl-L-tyrosine phosphorylase/[glutamate--ammonia-ligase] adenylyltransferase [Marinobacter daepoensis]|uniref:Bifunctional glutamine synthetase adenylyltransferase/adenylyl-removing enzyme n=1 Tax=Marinobacter daepoensis TaxID=262077 RepID=A0ABS3BGG8_9GAMM|nr:bifunctional [glutamate--ammonia ligase]-adenylyl-L-tyrosine phosphorylase/[glutamate--ammonia-ligase] adenylyltransferase [Marinobacter daepoensis]MBN7770587.1 bifunctional [glutamate--ammonia ligase]-adenylyl-L-tyrosine phosphorylase/[glutamate--ammonia-ligase] adenylyltransferase [Marinobacter daepoensis]MBY6080529.1 bifunctional [glutamate--ammonia ligase]-adenylyl-L-tyrosine phosphorylase/[glutamate--ammonia-ligase] adenylyltransferase [Marinobacter daepoensis]